MKLVYPKSQVSFHEIFHRGMWRVRFTRRFLQRMDPLEMEEAEFVDRYRLPKSVVKELSNELEPFLYHQTRRNYSLSVEQQVCIALRYYAEGDYMRELGDIHGISEMTSGRVVHAVSSALCEIHHRYISWPTSEEISLSKERFYRYCGMPRTVACIDDTQIRILAPVDNESVYVNRKGWHSVNCQIVCDSTLKIFDISPRWPGSSHDAYMLRNSGAWDHISNLSDCYVLGDSAYPLLSSLMKPYNNPLNHAEENFNKALTKGRACVERCIGIFKSRFRCLSKTMTFSPAKCSRIILGCAVLHNVATDCNAVFDPPIDVSENDASDIGHHIPADVNGSLVRRQDTNNFFNNA